MRWSCVILFVTWLREYSHGTDLTSSCSLSPRGSCQRPPQHQRQRRPPGKVDVAIVGGGLAGISAALVLTRYLDVKRVLVLEATERFGGRIEATSPAEFGGVAANIGANWIHFAENNPVTSLAQQLGCPLSPCNNSNLRWSATGLGVLSSQAVNDAAAFAKELAARACGAAPANVSAAKHLAQLTSALHENQISSTPASEAARHLHFFADVVLDHTAYLSRLSGAGLDTAPAGGDRTGHDVHLSGSRGAECLVDGILAGLPAEGLVNGVALRTRTVVKEIRLVHGPVSGSATRKQATDFPVEILVESSGLQSLSRVRAKAVVVAVPLGVLRESEGLGSDVSAESAVKDLRGLLRFEPPLPQQRLARWRRVGVGQSLRAALKFDEVFWDANVEHFGHLLELPNGSFEEQFYGEALTAEFTNLLNVSGHPVLLVEVSWHLADQLEKLEDAEIANFLIENALKHMFPEVAVPQPVAVAIKRFGADPYTRGALSFPSVAQGADGLKESVKEMEKDSEEKYGVLDEEEDVEDDGDDDDDDGEEDDDHAADGEQEWNQAGKSQALWAPLWSGRLLFAGEHTSYRPGTLDGALLSGVQAAWNVGCVLGSGATWADPVTLVEEVGIFGGWFENKTRTRNCMRRFVAWLYNRGRAGCTERWLDMLEASCRDEGKSRSDNHRNCLDQGD